jgi:hypothetical protein
LQRSVLVHKSMDRCEKILCPLPPPFEQLQVQSVSYEEEDTCVSYEEEDTCVSYEEEDTCVSYEEEDTCVSSF